MKTKFIILILLYFSILSCGKPSPTFNPFDELFDIDINMLYNDSTLKRVGDCMAYMHIKNHGDHETYYTVYTLSPKKDSIAGKGLNIPLKRKKITEHVHESLSYRDSLVIKKQIEVINYVKQLPIDTVKVDSILKIYSLTRTESFMKFNLITGENDYFFICKNPEGKEFLFENKYDHTWLSNGKVMGKRLLKFDTYISTKIDLEDSPYYN